MNSIVLTKAAQKLLKQARRPRLYAGCGKKQASSITGTKNHHEVCKFKKQPIKTVISTSQIHLKPSGIMDILQQNKQSQFKKKRFYNPESVAVLLTNILTFKPTHTLYICVMGTEHTQF